MKAKGIAPFTYPGIYAGYLSALVFPAYTQFGGDEFVSKLTNPKESDIPDLYKDEAFLKTYTQLESLFKNGWIMKGTQALDHTASQMEFLNGKAAMIFNGAWMENEMKQSIPEGFRMRIMPIPPTADAKVKEMMAVADSRDWGGIPSSSKHIDVAKEFLLLSATEESNRKFTELTGAPRAFKYSIDGMNLSDFTKSAIEMLSKYKTVSYIYAPQAIGDGPSGVDFYAAIASGDNTPQEIIDKNVKAAPDKWKEQQKTINSK
jgi:N-acetylglucosamine transport system substrate-binding protein